MALGCQHHSVTLDKNILNVKYIMYDHALDGLL